jgi:hypothetical protein
MREQIMKLEQLMVAKQPTSQNQLPQLAGFTPRRDEDAQ